MDEPAPLPPTAPEAQAGTPAPAPHIAAVATATRDALVAHLQTSTAADDERLESERDARIAATLGRLRDAGALPPAAAQATASRALPPAVQPQRADAATAVASGERVLLRRPIAWLLIPGAIVGALPAIMAGALLLANAFPLAGCPRRWAPLRSAPASSGWCPGRRSCSSTRKRPRSPSPGS